MRIALIGAGGQLGTGLRDCLAGEVVPLPRDRLDITRADLIPITLDEIRPDLVINAAAYNFVDRAEDDPEAALAGNALGPRNLALCCESRGIPLVHFSTDYVFGLDPVRTTPFCETDAPGPLGVYGASKLLGEYFVRATCSRHYVVRTCGLYGRASSPGKGNFVETMLRLGSERRELRVVDDQWCTPTSAAHLARAIAGLITTGKYGLYHATSSGGTTWCRFATEVFRLAGMDVTVKPVTTKEFGAKARRPAYSVLDCARLTAVIGSPLPDWQTALAEYLVERAAHGR